MSEVKKYLIQKTPIGTLMKVHAQGNWVELSDYDAALAREAEVGRLYDSLVNRSNRERDASEKREAALREELDNHDCATLLINAWVDAHGKQIPWDKAIEIIAVATKMPDAEKTRLLCLDDQYELLQQRLTVAEQREVELKRLLCDVINEAPTGFAALKVDLAHRVNAALKPAADAKPSRSCPNCKVCMGSPDFPENCLINGVKP